MAAHEGPLLVVERPFLVQDPVGNGDLADVVKLRGTLQVLQVVATNAQPLPHRARERGNGAGVLVQLGASFRQHAQHYVASLLLRGHAPDPLVGVHALVGQNERGGGILRLFGNRDAAARSLDREALAALGERLEACGDEKAAVVRGHRSEDAELVPAESERDAAALDHLLKLPAEAAQEQVSLQMAEGVVVRLEAVQVEEHEQLAPVECVEVLHEPATVGQPGQSVVVGEVLELRLEALPFRDVEDRTVEIEDLTVGVADGSPLLVYPAHLAVGGEHAVFEDERLPLRHARVHLVLDRTAVVGMNDARVGARLVSDELGRRVAGDLLDPLAHELHLPVALEGAPVDRAGHVGH
jgi:hypothetical protein